MNSKYQTLSYKQINLGIEFGHCCLSFSKINKKIKERKKIKIAVVTQS